MDTNKRIVNRRKRTHLLKQYGINLDQYEIMLADQNRVCAICGKPEGFNHKTLAVDHCHETNKVRGLLCSNCNQGLGKFADNIELLSNAIEYLNRDYEVPLAQDSIGLITHKDRPNWKLLICTPDGKFSSAVQASKHYNVHPSTVCHWCNPKSKWKKDGFTSQKMFISSNQLQAIIDSGRKV